MVISKSNFEGLFSLVIFRAHFWVVIIGISKQMSERISEWISEQISKQITKNISVKRIRRKNISKEKEETL